MQQELRITPLSRYIMYIKLVSQPDPPDMRSGPSESQTHTEGDSQGYHI